MSLLIRGPLVNGRQCSIYVDNGVIAALGEDRSADRVIDGEGLYAFPSFGNGHTHAAMTLFRGYGDDLPLMVWLETRIWPAERLLTEEDVYAGTRLALLEMIRSGTTYLNDMYWHREGVARAVEEMGMKAHVASVFIDLGDPKKAEEQRARTLDLLEREALGSGRVRTALGPHAVYTVSEESLAWIGETARKHDLLVHIHLSETRTEVEECRSKHGVGPVELLDRAGLLGPNLVAAHGVWLEPKEREMLAGAGATVVTNPTSNLKLAVGRIFDYTSTRAAGLRVVLGTDGAASNNNLDLVEEMKIAALLAKHLSGDPTALPADEALGLATSAPAEAFGLGSGTIEVGSPADLILVDLSRPSTQPVHEPVSNLVYAANGGAVHTTICDGRVLMHERRVEVADEEEIVAAAGSAAADLARRAEEAAA